jgi:deoxyribodipyrimidine photolyase
MPEANVLQPGEKAARHRLKRFLRGAIFEYAAQRNQPSLEATSRLSQDFRFGTPLAAQGLRRLPRNRVHLHAGGASL